MYLFRFRITDLPISPAYQLLFLVIAIVVSFVSCIIVDKVIIARHSYKCTECDHHFRVKWYKGATIASHDEKGRDMRCPHCKKMTYCKYDD